MASISSLGAGSGLDLENLLSQLLAAETLPVENRLNTREANIQATISGLGAFKSALDELDGSVTTLTKPDTFSSRAATSSNNDIFTVSATNDASYGSYDVNVLNLASNNKLASGDFANADATVGSGTLSFTVGATSFDVAITAGVDDTVEGIKNAINSASDNNNLLSATLLTVDNGLGDGGTVTKLVLTANQTGADNQISVTVADDDGQNVDAVGLSQLSSGTAGTPGGIERLAPDGEVFSATGFALLPLPDVSAITDDPDAADGNFLVAFDEKTDTSVRTSFPAPSGDLKIGADLQEIRVAAREFADSGSGTPRLNIEIYEAGNPTPLYSSPTQDVEGNLTQVFSFTFDASILADLSGRDLEVVVFGENRNDSAIDIGAVEFNADVEPQPPTGQLIELQAAQDARITVDGFTAYSSSNVFDDVIEGVTITALSESPDPLNDPPETLTIALDSSTVTSGVNNFIESYNALVDTLSQLTSFDVDSGTSSALNGDFTVRTLETQLRRVFFANVAGVDASLNTLVELGITTTESGTLELDQARLDAAVASDLESVTAFFSGPGGFATRLEEILDSYVGPTGIIQSREVSLNESLGDIADERVDLALRLENVERRFRNQFSALDSLVANLNSQGDFLLQQLNNTSNIINGSSNSDN